MDKFLRHEGIVVALVRDNIDTDQIMPKQFLKRVERSGFGEFVFYDWRYEKDGTKDRSFVLNDPGYENASVLLTGNNFGCGSSREHAPWGLYELGIRVIVAKGFADIFYNNCFKTGLLPIRASDEVIDKMAGHAEAGKGYGVSVDLEAQTLSDTGGILILFAVDPFRKACLMGGLDDIGLTERYAEDISRYEEKAGITDR